MSVITVSRQLGSLGDEVAQAIGNRLNYRVVCRDLINQAARRARQPEVALATIDDLDLFGFRPPKTARLAYQKAVSEILEELAVQGNAVIVGRAGQVILKEYDDVFHVKVIAPANLRAKRISNSQRISYQTARAQIETSDRARRNYLLRYYNARWDDPELYDMIINTDRIDPEQAAYLVCQAIAQCFQ